MAQKREAIVLLGQAHKSCIPQNARHLCVGGADPCFLSSSLNLNQSRVESTHANPDPNNQL